MTRTLALALLLFAIASPAFATNIAVGIRCERGYAFTSSVAGVGEIDGCTHHDVELDVLLGAQVVGVLLTGQVGRIIAAGATPTLGVKLVYKPKAFALPEVIGAFVTLAGSLVDIAGAASMMMMDGVGRFEGWLVMGVTALGFWYAGIGPYLELRDGRTYVDLILSTGFAVPI